MISTYSFDKLLAEIKKPSANPGGGALVIMVANMAVNLIFMMDKKDYGGLEKQANVSRETLNHISDLLTNLADEDIEYATILVEKCIKEENVDEKYFIDATRPQIKLNTLVLEAMKHLGFFLEHGKAYTLSDGEIANILLKAVIDASLPTIKLNLKQTNFKYNIEEVEKEAKRLYEKNLIIIERRKS